MSDDEMHSGSSSGEEEMETGKGGAAKKILPTYEKMLVEAIREQQTTWNTGISRAKIVEYIKTKYHLEDVNASALKNAIKKAEEKEIIEHKTGTGASGSFILTKKERAAQTKKIADKEKADKKKAAGEKAKAEKAEKTAEKPKTDAKSKTTKTEPKTKPKTDKKSKDDMDLKDLKKDVKKKPPVAKGKENKDTKEKATKKDDKTTSGTKKPALGKSKSHSAVSNVVMDDAIPSTSKQKKAVPAKKAKTAK